MQEWGSGLDDLMHPSSLTFASSQADFVSFPGWYRLVRYGKGGGSRFPDVFLCLKCSTG